MTQASSSLLRRTVTAQLSADEHALFLLACERSGLDPFARQIYFLRDRGKLVIEATIDGLRLSAERTGNYAGQLGPEWCGPDGVWLDIWTTAEPPTAARVGIRRKEFTDPIWGKALYSEFVQRENEFWTGMPALMLSKCAEALAFRKAFPREFSGLSLPLPVRSKLRAGRRSPRVQIANCIRDFEARISVLEALIDPARPHFEMPGTANVKPGAQEPAGGNSTLRNRGMNQP